jgi:hypothetical protein
VTKKESIIMALDLKKLKERLTTVQTGGVKKKTKFWRPQNGDQTVRIVPTKDGDPFKSLALHYNVGKNFGFLCPKRNFDESCPVCDFASKLWQEGTDDSKEMAKKLFPRERFYAPVLPRGAEENEVLMWSFGKTVYETLIKYCLNPEYGDITDVETGVDLDLNYETPPGASFPKTTLQPKRKSTKLCEDITKEECKELLDSVPDLMSLFDRKSSKECEQMLNEWLSEESSAEDGKETVKYEASESKQEKSSIDKEFDDLLGDE